MARRATLVVLAAALVVALAACAEPGAPDASSSSSASPAPLVDATPTPEATTEPVPESIATLTPLRTEPFADPSATSLGFLAAGQAGWLRQWLPRFHTVVPVGPTAVQITGPEPGDAQPWLSEGYVPVLDMVSDPALSAAACEGEPGWTLVAVEPFTGSGDVSAEAWAEPGMEPVVATIAQEGPSGLEVRTGLTHARLLSGDCAEPFVVDPVEGTPSSIVSSAGRWPIASLDEVDAVLAGDDHQAIRVMLRTIVFLC